MKPHLVFALLAMSIFTPNLVFAEEGTSLVDVDGTTHEVSYDAIGLTVDEMATDISPQPTLIVFVTTDELESSLEITLDRDFLDSKENGEDVDFIVLLDGFELLEDFEETTNESERILAIQVPSGVSSIDIIGTVFGSEQPEETQSEEPETSEEPTAPEETEEPQTQCGPGTVLQDGACVLVTEEPETPEEPTAPEETEEPQTQCGPGTVLQDGACVLDERCGPGTLFKDGQCVLVEAPQKTTSSRGATFELAVGVIAAFIIAFIVMIILWAIGRAGRSKNNH